MCVCEEGRGAQVRTFLALGEVVGQQQQGGRGVKTLKNMP